jgi:carbon-monoxide dehydrogenase iron sulfur subunit
MSQLKEIFVRVDRCLGCHSCEMACAVEHSQGKSVHGATGEHPQPKPRVYVEGLSSNQSLPVLCRHCEEAPCMHACIAGAISRTNNVVTTNPDKCIGCWTCVMVCPYGVIGRHLEEHKAYRCDRCPERTVPACVSACPTKALVFRTVEDYSKGIRQTAAIEMAAAKRS